MRLTHSRVAALLACAASATFVGTVPAHAVDRDCGDFSSQRAAQVFFLNHGGPDRDPHGLDDDGDGVACESNPAPTYYGQTPPGGGGGGGSTSTVKSSVSLALSRGSAVQGEAVRLVAKVRPASKRTVVFQKRTNRGWRAVGRTASTARGKAVRRITAPRATTAYRATVTAKRAGGKKMSAAASSGKRLRVLQQNVTLTLSDSQVEQGTVVTARTSATPVRDGRPMSLQLWGVDGWQTLDHLRQNRSGHAAFTFATQEPGEYDFRVVANRHNGAVGATSVTRSLSVVGDTASARH